LRLPATFSRDRTMIKRAHPRSQVLTSRVVPVRELGRKAKPDRSTKQPVAKTAKTELVPMNTTAATLIPTNRRYNLVAWFELTAGKGLKAARLHAIRCNFAC
jgi:hypothetical protein